MTSTIKVNNVQNQCGQNIINENSNTITIGASGDTIALASGASQTGFGRTGTVDWQTGSIKTGTFTAVNGEGYFVDTSSGVSTANLPAGSAGAIVSFSDYTRTFGTNTLTVSPNGSEKIGGVEGDATLNVNGQAATFIYVDGTEGWINVQETQSSKTGGTGFIMATGGTITESGDCRIHTFTGPGTFTVCGIANTAACNQVSYLVVAGGGGGGDDYGGGGGAGGFREDKSPITPYTASPLEGSGSITVTATDFPIGVGGGGAVGSSPCGGVSGTNSTFLTITSAGGGGGGSNPSPAGIGTGGSGGGGGAYSPLPYSFTSFNPGAAGNTPPVSPPQGNTGGKGVKAPSGVSAGGGGGATAVGGDVVSPSPTPYATTGGPGGAGATTSISGSPTAYSGGGGGASEGGTTISGGTGGGGTGRTPASGAATNGTANTGGGGGGGYSGSIGAGGSGIVIIRYKFQ